MKKFLVRALAVSLFLMVVPQRTEAQFLKSLGKVLQTVGENVLNGTGTNATTSGQATPSQPATTNQAPNPMVRVEVTNCYRLGKNVCIQLTLNNYGSQDKEVEIYNEWEDFTTAVYDGSGARYAMGLVVDNSFRDLSVTSFVSVKCPRQVPVKVIVVAAGVPQETKQIGRLNFTVAKFVNTVRDIPIREFDCSTNREGLTCNMPSIKCHFLSCVRTEADWTVTYVLTPDKDLSLQWKIDDVGIYDSEGNTYGWSINMPGIKGSQVSLLKDTPAQLKLTIKNVPSSVTKLHTLLLPFSVGFYRMPFSYEIRMTGLTLSSQTSSSAASAATSPATGFILAGGKLGPISRGAKASSFPKQVDGLYDKYEYESWENEGEGYTEAYYLFSRGGKPVFRANVDPETKVVTGFTLLEGATNVKTPDGFYVGCSAREVFQKKKLNWMFDFSTGVIGSGGGYCYTIDGEGMAVPESAPEKLSDIKSSAKITEISH